MKKGSRTKLNRIILIIAVFALMLILSGCRTRVSNNSEVLSVYTDESGYMTEDYQYRRDDLGIPVAKKPYINLNTEDDTYDEDYEDEDFNYDRSEREDDEDIDEEEEDSKDSPSTSTSTTTKPSSTSSTTTTRRPTTVTRRPSTTTTTTTVTVNFNANGGTIKSGTKKVKILSRSCRKGSSLGSLPTPTKTDSTFQGWYTQKSGGSKVSSKTVVNYSTTYYAHWKDGKKSSDSGNDKKPEPTPEPEKKEYKVAWQYDDDVTVEGDMPNTFSEGDTYPSPLPVAKKKNSHFFGWHDGSDYISAGQKVTSDATLTADFKTWEEIYQQKASDAGNNTVFVDGGVDDLVHGDKVAIDEQPEYVVIGMSNIDDANGAKLREQYPGSTIIVIPEKATKSSNETYYKLLLLSLMYNGSVSADELADARSETSPDISKYRIF